MQGRLSQLAQSATKKAVLLDSQKSSHYKSGRGRVLFILQASARLQWAGGIREHRADIISRLQSLYTMEQPRLSSFQMLLLQQLCTVAFAIRIILCSAEEFLLRGSPFELMD